MTIRQNLSNSITAINNIAKIKTLAQAQNAYINADALEQSASLARCAIMYRIQSEKLFEKGGYKSFSDFANKCTYAGRSTVGASAKIGKYIDPETLKDTFEKKSERPFTYTQLKIIIEGLPEDTAKKLIKDGAIYPELTSDETKKVVDFYKTHKEVTDNGESVKAETIIENANKEKAEKDKEKSDKKVGEKAIKEKPVKECNTVNITDFIKMLKALKGKKFTITVLSDITDESVKVNVTR